jgi:hypothetical protein
MKGKILDEAHLTAKYRREIRRFSSPEIMAGQNHVGREWG